MTAHRLSRETRLELGADGGGTRHFIDDYALHAGDPIAAKVDETWVDGRYEAKWQRGQLIAAWFCFVDRFGNELAIRLTEDTPVRR